MPISPKFRRTRPRTQVLPEIPIVEEMKMWDRQTVLQWIQQRNSLIFQGDDLNSFDGAGICGEVFLDTSYDFFRKECGILPGPSLTLTRYRDEVLRTATLSPKDKRKRDDESVAPESPTSKPSKRRYQAQKQKDRADDDDKEENDYDHDYDTDSAASYNDPSFVPPAKRPEHTPGILGNDYQQRGRPAHKECVVNFGDLNRELWAKYQEAQEKAEKEKADKNAQRGITEESATEYRTGSNRGGKDRIGAETTGIRTKGH
ncbi:uncharacterized protein Z518_09090 [Rhinocladiella mackenziei CBS 650.93]|uniref:SAM domain-containing protein n=1 Tax=Rhinocladiella mackenziei CBS 650.93 TaxID=1442369 RepID=A0A0D2IXQ2_9EURO|nr:uncharacterized protein Z518_09090 [Rhinocladiella mackenziei CBS 650.93]KIX01365.1 hypothetical protein Z518_09090 [Rhinocladiella mackenziei CBS 650.93]